ncbi:hypothetical protein HA466_0221740 [Hirschfeldia incana]|nr:hypothetical protein HA466_0221740 [Hirschfeldia incana]
MAGTSAEVPLPPDYEARLTFLLLYLCHFGFLSYEKRILIFQQAQIRRAKPLLLEDPSASLVVGLVIGKGGETINQVSLFKANTRAVCETTT